LSPERATLPSHVRLVLLHPPVLSLITALSINGYYVPCFKWYTLEVVHLGRFAYVPRVNSHTVVVRVLSQALHHMFRLVCTYFPFLMF